MIRRWQGGARTPHPAATTSAVEGAIMAQDENSTTQNMTGLQKPAYIEYDPKAEAVCGICMSVVPLHFPHACIKQGQTTDGSGHVLDPDKPTLRDQFAMAAPIGLQRVGAGSYGTNANARYEWADAMMAARKNPPK